MNCRPPAQLAAPRGRADAAGGARDRDRRLLTGASYEQIGGVAGALARHAHPVAVSIGELCPAHPDRERVDRVVSLDQARRDPRRCVDHVARADSASGASRTAGG
ncbi:MAG TPA: hypothetical protein VHW23_29315 [Kofleriaceae bacterium]|nr:hypothetical protein [Kofleriaceae bacterium]